MDGPSGAKVETSRYAIPMMDPWTSRPTGAAPHGTICERSLVALVAGTPTLSLFRAFGPIAEEIMSRYWSAIVHGLTPYVPGEQPRLDNLVKLNTNEHPYGPSPLALEAIRAATGDTLRLYPDPNAEALKAALATYHGLQPDQVFVGNGSDEVLAHAFLALLKQEQPLWFPDITYSFYPVYCGLYGIGHEAVPLADDFSIRVEDYLPGPGRRAGGIIFANPNAPTGRLLSLPDVERIVAGNPDIVVVVDEAYVDFGGKSAFRLVDRYPNLLVVQTFSKSRSLAGLRVGFALGSPQLIEALERVKNSFNSYPLDRLAIAGAVASVQDEAHFQQNRQKVMATREVLASCLGALGFEVLPSAANFIFVRHPGRDAGELAADLRRRAILVRHFRLPRIDQFLRITIGTDEQCRILVEALKNILGQCVCHPGGQH
jgi:histidinol-phosphate aminotransferase